MNENKLLIPEPKVLSIYWDIILHSYYSLSY